MEKRKRRYPIIKVDAERLVAKIYSLYEEERRQRVLDGKKKDNSLRRYLERNTGMSIWSLTEIERNGVIRSKKIFDKVSKIVDLRDYVI